MKNAEIAAAFDELATLYELDGVVVYRVLAYRNAAKAIRDSGVSVAELARQGRAQELSGIGKTIAEKIQALLLEGEIPAARKLGDRDSGVADRLRRVAVGEHPVDDGAVELVERSELVEGSGDVGVLHGPVLACRRVT